MGGQTCNAEGSSFGACVCALTADGGADGGLPDGGRPCPALAASFTDRDGLVWRTPAVEPSCAAPSELRIIGQSCDPSVDPLLGVTSLRLLVRAADGGASDEVISLAAPTGTLRLPALPMGQGLVIEARGYDTAGGTVLSWGRTMPFDNPPNGAASTFNLVLRKVGVFSPIVSATNPTQCRQLRAARAGHSATLLDSGRVFIAGGYSLVTGSTEQVALSAAELFDPTTGEFMAAKPVSISSQGMLYELPRAYHAAVKLQSGQVMLWGGEIYSGGMNNTVSPLSSILFYDETVDDYGALGPRVPAAISRTRHKAAIDENGKVLVVGGLTRAVGVLVAVNEVEWLDPATNLYKIVPGVTLPRLEATVMPVKQGELIAVVGGTDGVALTTDISFFKFTGADFGKQTSANPPRLAGVGRRAAAAGLLRNATDLAVFGGYSDATLLQPVASSELLRAGSGLDFTIAPGPDIRTARGDSCAATMGNGVVLLTGGRTSDSAGPPRADDTSVLIEANLAGGVTSIGTQNLPQPRYHHACTTLLDGTVLVTGGINESVSAVVILDDARIYTPIPGD